MTKILINSKNKNLISNNHHLVSVQKNHKKMVKKVSRIVKEIINKIKIKKGVKI